MEQEVEQKFTNPELSVYYHPVLNPYGAPPPGAAPKFREAPEGFHGNLRLTGPQGEVLLLTSGADGTRQKTPLRPLELPPLPPGPPPENTVPDLPPLPQSPPPLPDSPPPLPSDGDLSETLPESAEEPASTLYTLPPPPGIQYSRLPPPPGMGLPPPPGMGFPPPGIPSASSLPAPSEDSPYVYHPPPQRFVPPPSRGPPKVNFPGRRDPPPTPPTAQAYPPEGPEYYQEEEEEDYPVFIPTSLRVQRETQPPRKAAVPRSVAQASARKQSTAKQPKGDKEDKEEAYAEFMKDMKQLGAV